MRAGEVITVKSSRVLDAALLVPTVLPVVYLVVFLVSTIRQVNAGSAAVPIFGSFETMAKIHVAVIILSLALTVFYVVHAMRNPSLTSEQRMLWVVILLIGSFLFAGIYWFQYVWKARNNGKIALPSDLCP